MRAFLGRRFHAEVADDATQEVFLRLHKRPPAMPSEPRSFLLRVATNAAIDGLRRTACRQQYEALTPPPAAAPTACRVLEQREDLALLRAAIAGLPPRCREVFLLQRFAGLSYEMVGERLGISTGTVEKHMTRALAACRAAVPDHDGVASVARG